MIPAVFKQILQMQKSNNTEKQISKNNKWAEVEYIIYRKKTEVSKYKVGK